MHALVNTVQKSCYAWSQSLLQLWVLWCCIFLRLASIIIITVKNELLGVFAKLFIEAFLALLVMLMYKIFVIQHLFLMSVIWSVFLQGEIIKAWCYFILFSFPIKTKKKDQSTSPSLITSWLPTLSVALVSTEDGHIQSCSNYYFYIINGLNDQSHDSAAILTCTEFFSQLIVLVLQTTA